MQLARASLLIPGLIFLLLPACTPNASLPTQGQIGDRVESVLCNAVCIELVANVHQVQLQEGSSPIAGIEPVSCKAVMAKNAFKSEVFKADKLIMAFSLVDGRMQEYRPRQKHRPLFEYDASHINGNGASILDEVEDCLVGTETSYSWIGESPDSTVTTRGQRWHTIIEQGVQQADAVERGHDCYVFRQEFPVDGGVIANEVYVDKQTFLVIRWDGFQPGIQRIRLFDITLLPKVPKNFDWKIRVSKPSKLHDMLKGADWEVKPPG